ncbi:MAG: 5-(carboxyamino)imidazole ribonucleotide synthase [Flavobacteriaceae bacterium]|jgi:5-(carboxyamino)imidazole ribonucleotide synthase|nr:5-(carboxyamino)imidazole ribonucleotide synthase [Pelagibacterales bacterium]MBT6170816.1 5-(carboxyamino)imidazole ribonucleotide synthase [Flavobacteriaceae bacterium]MBT6448931.1 5-(carboxyamino)imidazole ribonucleotide synthase [Flavobacteriaceae bacterium]MDG1831542.1 5-(carboxyamino)imidazole ribonucleotide synthase [Flavobacteriaceae bacterium]
MNYFSSNFTLGILGGGQLGKMLLQVTSKLSIKTNILDSSPNSPCKNLCNEFQTGNLMDFNSVYKFGKKCDLITYEIEHVNIEALEKLESDGIKVYPSSKTLKIIQDKSLQKKFFTENKIPTAKFWHFKSLQDYNSSSVKNEIKFPCVWKKTKFGYDGFGVEIINSSNDFEKLPETEFIIEELISFKKEIATTIARNESGQIEVFPVVEMIFNEISNQVEYVICPAQINDDIKDKAKEIALNVSKSFEQIGLLAVEMFLTNDNKILVNEVAPRPHNSAHYSIEACTNSQFEQHIKSILDLPLGCSKSNIYAIMVNLVGEKGFSGPVVYSGIEEAMQYDNVSVHIYGKSETKPNRKMGHATILDTSLKNGLSRAKSIKKIIKIKTS